MKMKQYLSEQFLTTFQAEPSKFYSCGGRFEILGNHTDHNNGLCIAATCDLEIYAAVNKREDLMVRILSEGFGYFELDLSNLDRIDDEIGKPAALIRGIISNLSNAYEVGGFDAYIKSNIPSGAGVSSSAAFELLIARIIDDLYNNNEISKMSLCLASQYAEREYYGKTCGLLDQIGVAANGLVFIDFADIANPYVASIDRTLPNHQFLIVNSGGSHAELSPLYDSITKDMYAVADYFKKGYLRDVDHRELLQNKVDVIEKCGQLAYERAEHFFSENERVKEAVKALQAGDAKTLMNLMNESRKSSTNLLHNMFVDKKKDSPLEACELIMKAAHRKAGVKINGGGFAGSVIALVDKDVLHEVVKAVKERYGKDNVYLVNIKTSESSDLE